MSTWGICMPVAPSVTAGMGGDQACSAGTETNCIITSAAFTSTNPSTSYFCWAVGVIVILFGATAPTAAQVALRLVGGVDMDAQTVPTGLLVASTTLALPFTLLGGANRGAWASNVANLAVSMTATGQAVTVKAAGSRMVATLLVGQDL